MTTSSRRWVLASASPRRSEILRGLGLDFEVAPSIVPEPPPAAGEPPSRYAIRAARIKAGDVAARFRSELVVAADTIVVAGDLIMGKPSSPAGARSMLESLSGRWHEVISGISLIDCSSARQRSGSSCSRVHFRRLTTREISWYLSKGEYRDKAGGYGIQGYAALLIDRIEGCYFNVVGFPVAAFARLCRAMDIDLFG